MVTHLVGLARELSLQVELSRRGVTLDWNPDRPLNDAWAKPTKHEDLARFVRTFMAHVKSNSWTRDALESRLTSELTELWDAPVQTPALRWGR